MSDRFGRRRPVLVGVAAYVVTSALCALSPTIPTLVAARFVQGLAGGVGIVISQAAGRDLYSGGKLVRYYGRLTVIAGLAAVVGPVLGGQLAAALFHLPVVAVILSLFTMVSGVATSTPPHPWSASAAATTPSHSDSSPSPPLCSPASST